LSFQTTEEAEMGRIVIIGKEDIVGEDGKSWAWWCLACAFSRMLLSREIS
jgi:hypothetical protein